MGRGPTELYHEPMDDAYVDGTLTCLKPSTIQNHISTEFPLVLNIEPTNACNLRCICCPRDKAVLRQGTNYLSVELFRKIIDEACEGCKPHSIANYLFDVASQFNQFYRDCPVLPEKNAKIRIGRLALVDATRIVLQNGLDLLGIVAPEEM